MSRKLTKENSLQSAGVRLASLDKSSVKFALCISRKLENKYGFGTMDGSDVKYFGNFLDKYVGQTISNVEANCKRPSDTDDVIDGKRILHFEVTRKFRIHGYYQDGVFHVCRIDPKHDVHR